MLDGSMILGQRGTQTICLVVPHICSRKGAKLETRDTQTPRPTFGNVNTVCLGWNVKIRALNSLDDSNVHLGLGTTELIGVLNFTERTQLKVAQVT